MPDVTANSQRQPEDRFLDWVDALVDPVETTPVPDAALADIAGTAAFVQRAAGPGSAPSLSPDRTEKMWEEIMHTAPAPATLTPTLTASDGMRSIASRTIPSAPAPGWRSFVTTALLIAAIVVAGIAAAWRIAGPFDLIPGGDGSKTANQPGIAGSATPTASAAGCPLSSDTPLFPAGAPPGAADLGTTYAVVEDGNLTIQCSGVDEPEPLMTGVTNATPLPWPGTVLLELDSGEVLAYNIATDQRIGFGNLASTSASVASPGSPWMLIPVGPDVHITNLQTMHKTGLAVIAGGKLPDSYAPVVISSPNSAVAVITDPSASPSAADEMPGTALVIDETLESRRWIDVQGQVVVGDGVIAYETRSDGQSLVRVEDADTGEAVFDVGPVDTTGTPGQRFVLAGDGETLVYIHDWRLWTTSFRERSESNPPIQLVGTDSRQPAAVYSTGVPGRVLVEWIGDESIGGPGEPGAKTVSILDVVTGELTDVAGLLPVDPEVPARFANAQYLVAVEPASDSSDQVVARMIDIATGETVVTSEPIDASVSELIGANNVFGSSLTGAVVTVSPVDGAPVLLDATTGEASPVPTEALPVTGDLGDIAWHVTPSSDGALLFAIGRPQPEGNSGVDITTPNALPGMFVVAPASHEPEWGEPVERLPAGVILGIPGESTSDEPAVLEAQEFDATPTPAASPVADATGCDLTADIPVVTGTELELPGTVLRLVDGSLMLECDVSASVVAEGVAGIVPGSTWPGAVLLHMDDGSLRGVNLITGAEGDLGEYTDQSQLAYGRTSRWIFFPTSPEQLDWRIIDLETMDSFLLSDELGGVLPRSTVAHLWATTPDAAVIGFGGVPILPPGTGSFDLGATPAAGTPTAELPAEWSALIIDGSLDNRRWIETFRPTFTSAWISPDGELLAYTRSTEDGPTVRVERLSDGTRIADTGIDLGESDTYLVLDDALLRLAPDRLDRVSWDANGEITIKTLLAFDEPWQNPVLRQTTDPNVVVASVGTPGPSGNSAGYLIDVDSGAVTEVPGMMQMPLVMAQYDDGAPVGYVLAAVPASGMAQSVVRLVDVTSGTPVASSAPIDVDPVGLAGRPAALRGDRGFVFLPDGRTVVLDANRGEAFTIEPPEDLQLTYQMPSPSGDVLAVASGNVYYARAVTQDAEWIEVSPESQVWFLPGADSQHQ